MLKHTVRIFLAILTYAPFAGWAQTPSDNKESKPKVNQRFLWKVQGTSNSIFLLGTMAAPNEGPPLIDSKMQEAYAASPIIGVLYNTTEAEVMIRLAEKMGSRERYPFGDTIRAHVSPRTYEEILRCFAGNTNAWHERFLRGFGVTTNDWQWSRPWVLALWISSDEWDRQGFGGSNSVENYFVTKAKQEKKSFISLEPADTGLNVVSELADAEAEMHLVETINEAEYHKKHAKSIYEAWKAGAVRRFVQVSRCDEVPKSFAGWKLDRTRLWLPKLEKLLSGGTNALVIIPATHLVGREGVVELLELKGFKVKQL